MSERCVAAHGGFRYFLSRQVDRAGPPSSSTPALQLAGATRPAGHSGRETRTPPTASRPAHGKNEHHARRSSRRPSGLPARRRTPTRAATRTPGSRKPRSCLLLHLCTTRFPGATRRRGRSRRRRARRKRLPAWQGGRFECDDDEPAQQEWRGSGRAVSVRVGLARWKLGFGRRDRRGRRSGALGVECWIGLVGRLTVGTGDGEVPVLSYDVGRLRGSWHDPGVGFSRHTGTRCGGLTGTTERKSMYDTLDIVEPFEPLIVCEVTIVLLQLTMVS